MTGAFRIESLAAHHERERFECDVDALDRYLITQASQDIRRRVAACYVAVDAFSSRIAGFYTLSAGSVILGELPAPIARKLPRYPTVPVARVDRLAVDTRYHGKRLGGALLWDAVDRAARSEVRVFALIVDAKDAAATNFYRHFGFVSLVEDDRRLLLPLHSVRRNE